MDDSRWRNDSQFEDEVITKVEDGAIKCDGLVFFAGIPKDAWRTRPPCVGETVHMFGGGFGYPVRGVVIDPLGSPFVYYYRTKEEEIERHEKILVEAQVKKLAEFERDRADLDRRVAALPTILRARILLFRANCPTNFRVEFESYELFCCEQAVLIASALKTEAKVVSFARADYETQKQIVEGLSNEHSGNTFQMSAFLARCLTSDDPALAYKAHGACTPLVGCKEYGCVHPRPEMEKEMGS